MTGIPYFNVPAFDQAANDLRITQGWEVVSPGELDDPATRAAAKANETGELDADGTTNGQTWGDFLVRDIKLLVDDGIEAVVVLPGWENSRGARLETYVAYLTGLPVLRLSDLCPIPTNHLLWAWAGEGAPHVEPVLTGPAGG